MRYGIRRAEICPTWGQTWLHWPTGVALPRKMTVVTISNMATTALAWKSTQSAIQVKNKSQNKSQKARSSHLAWALVTQRDGFPWIRREFRGLPPAPRLKHRSLFFFFIIESNWRLCLQRKVHFRRNYFIFSFPKVVRKS